MKVTNSGRGVHKREVKGIERLRDALPNHWYAYTNLDVVIGLGKPREIDVVVVAEHRIFLLDIKDWYGSIESREGRWYQNGKERDRSPVAKVSETARELSPILKSSLAKRPETKALPAPWITGLVILTNRADISGIADTEQRSILFIEDFIAKVSNARSQREAFGNVASEFLSRPLTDAFWKEKLSRFFTGSGFQPGKRRFERYVAEEAPSFVPPHGIYQEFDARDENSANSLGTLRLWDFTKCPDVRFQTEEGRQEIAGRERDVFNWLRDRSEDVERTLLPPKVDDPDRTVAYWEIYDRRRRMQRLSQFAVTEAKRMLPAGRIELARQLLAALAGLHQQDAAHLDLDGHSIWLEAPTSVKFSHLLAARFPEGRSLGKSRFQFLASTGLPEEFYGVDEGPKKRDVFLAGVAVHTLLFGSKPAGNPPEWKSDIDAKGDFKSVHDWMAEALDHNPSSRFPDAVAAHTAFLKATATRPNHEELLEGLERFRGSVRSQRQLAALYPMIGEPIAESDAVDVWRSEQEGRPILVKLWKQAAWGDTHREAGVILSFLRRAADQRADRPAGLPLVRDVLWLGDSFVVIQDWIEGTTLRSLISTDSEADSAYALELVARLSATVGAFHEGGYGHGDLKPENIVIDVEGQPVLIDALDFAPSADGEIISDAYAPDGGDKFARDRFAITKIAEEFFRKSKFLQEEAARLHGAIRDVREKMPPLATLDPLLETIESIQAQREVAASPASLVGGIVISIRGANVGPVEPDEGFLYVRLHQDSSRGTRSLNIRGACEEIAFRLGAQGQVISGWRRQLEQRWIAKNAQSEFYRLALPLIVAGSDINDFSELAPVLETPAIKDMIATALRGGVAESTEEKGIDASSPEEDVAEDILSEEIAQSEPVVGDIDVRLLWRTLIDTENELTTEAVAQQASVFDPKKGLHRIPIELERGEFDFDREDRVGVEALYRNGEWRRVGDLEVQLSRPELAVFEARSQGQNRDALVDAGQRLRFTSHFELQSLKRRTHAVDRVLEGNGRLKNLLSVFDPRSEASPQAFDHTFDESLLRSYDLNEDQVSAFRRIVGTRPLGLLQGPPGTGKTRFIAALAHYAIAKGLVQNVLLTSQSHEAVNTAADSVLKHFRKAGIEPSLLRVAMSEELASPDLRPYHTQRVEQAFKDRFRAAFRERLALVGETLGLNDQVVDAMLILETVVQPLCRRIAHLSGSGERQAMRASDHATRLSELRETLKRRVDLLGLDMQRVADDTPDSELYGIIIAALSEYLRKTFRAEPDQIERLRTAATIGNDFVGSVSSAQRSFETFLAGTRQIVVGTCVGLGRTSLGLTSTAFDLVIVDEAARCTSGELLVPLQSARWAVLVGDQAQLEPHHKPEVVNLVWQRSKIAKREIQRSDFERVFSSNYGASAGARLKTQYRMLPPIGRLVSESFYTDLKLTAGREEPIIDPAVLPDGLKMPLTWIETDTFGELAFEQKDGTSSRSNRIEADAILASLEQWYTHPPFREWLISGEGSTAGVGIICMYAAQRDLLRRKIRQSSLHYLLDAAIKVGTVDSYQGKENPITIVSLVRNNDFGPVEFGVKRIKEGFLRAPNRINVSASRAMDRLVIVGARRRWPQHGPMGRLAKCFNQIMADGEASIVEAVTVLTVNDAGAAKSRTAPRASKETFHG